MANAEKLSRQNCGFIFNSVFTAVVGGDAVENGCIQLGKVVKTMPSLIQ